MHSSNHTNVQFPLIIVFVGVKYESSFPPALRFSTQPGDRVVTMFPAMTLKGKGRPSRLSIGRFWVSAMPRFLPGHGAAQGMLHDPPARLVVISRADGLPFGLQWKNHT
jgi:hypothetical protein